MNPDLVVRDKNGGIYTVRHEAVNALMLLNGFLKEHHKVEEQDLVLLYARHYRRLLAAPSRLS